MSRLWGGLEVALGGGRLPARAAVGPPPPPIVRVGHTETLSASGQSNVATVTATYGATGGNALVVGVTAWMNAVHTPTSVTVSDGVNTFNLVKSQWDGARTTSCIFVALNVANDVPPAPPLTITTVVTGTGVVWYVNLFVIEYSGVALASAVNGTPEGGLGTGSPIAVGTGVTTTHAAAVLCACWCTGDSNGTITIAPQNGFAAVDFSDGTVGIIGGTLERIVAATGTYVASTTRNPNGGSATYSIVECALKGQ